MHMNFKTSNLIAQIKIKKVKILWKVNIHNFKIDSKWTTKHVIKLTKITKFRKLKPFLTLESKLQLAPPLAKPNVGENDYLSPFLSRPLTCLLQRPTCWKFIIIYRVAQIVHFQAKIQTILSVQASLAAITGMGFIFIDVWHQARDRFAPKTNQNIRKNRKDRVETTDVIFLQIFEKSSAKWCQVVACTWWPGLNLQFSDLKPYRPLIGQFESYGVNQIDFQFWRF